MSDEQLLRLYRPPTLPSHNVCYYVVGSPAEAHVRYQIGPGRFEEADTPIPWSQCVDMLEGDRARLGVTHIGGHASGGSVLIASIWVDSAKICEQRREGRTIRAHCWCDVVAAKIEVGP